MSNPVKEKHYTYLTRNLDSQNLNKLVDLLKVDNNVTLVNIIILLYVSV